VVGGLSLREAALGLGLAGVDEVDELNTVLHEEDGNVVAAVWRRESGGREGEKGKSREGVRGGQPCKARGEDGRALIPNSLLGVELGGETTNLTSGLSSSVRSENRRETDKGGSLDADLGEDLGEDVLNEGSASKDGA
jgi:hypothetical protein